MPRSFETLRIGEAGVDGVRWDLRLVREHGGAGQHFDKVELFVAAATNEYNFTKLENPPAFEPTLCASCKRIIRLAEDGYSISRREYFCTGCSPMPRLG